MKIIIFTDASQGMAFISRTAAKKIRDKYSIPIIIQDEEKHPYRLGVKSEDFETVKDFSKQHILEINNDLRPYGNQEFLLILGGEGIRTNPGVIQIAEEMKEKFMRYGEFKILNIPDNADWIVDTNDYGVEFIRSNYEVWG